jgi:protein TonB
MMQKLGPALIGAALGMLLYWGLSHYLTGPAPVAASLPPASISLPPLTPVDVPTDATLTAGIRGAESGELTAGIRGAETSEVVGTMADRPAAPPADAAAPGSCHDHEVVPRVVVPPDYPYQARVDGQAGEVTVELTVASDGKVSAAHVVSSEPPQLFDQAALDAVKQWQFDPRTVACAPRAAQVRQVLKFLPNAGR